MYNALATAYYPTRPPYVPLPIIKKMFICGCYDITIMTGIYDSASSRFPSLLFRAIIYGHL